MKGARSTTKEPRQTEHPTRTKHGHNTSPSSYIQAREEVGTLQPTPTSPQDPCQMQCLCFQRSSLARDRLRGAFTTQGGAVGLRGVPYAYPSPRTPPLRRQSSRCPWYTRTSWGSSCVASISAVLPEAVWGIVLTHLSLASDRWMSSTHTWDEDRAGGKEQLKPRMVLPTSEVSRCTQTRLSTHAMNDCVKGTTRAAQTGERKTGNDVRDTRVRSYRGHCVEEWKGSENSEGKPSHGSTLYDTSSGVRRPAENMATNARTHTPFSCIEVSHEELDSFKKQVSPPRHALMRRTWRQHRRTSCGLVLQARSSPSCCTSTCARRRA